MKGVIVFYKDEFIEFIINPFSNISEEEEIFIKNFFETKINTKNSSLESNDEGDIKILSKENGFIDIYKNIEKK